MEVEGRTITNGGVESKDIISTQKLKRSISLVFGLVNHYMEKFLNKTNG